MKCDISHALNNLTLSYAVSLNYDYSASTTIDCNFIVSRTYQTLEELLTQAATKLGLSREDILEYHSLLVKNKPTNQTQVTNSNSKFNDELEAFL